LSNNSESVIATRVSTTTATRLRELARAQDRPLANLLRRMLDRHGAKADRAR